MMMATRERAYLGEEIVTVLSSDGNGKNANVEIRNAFGFVTTVKAHELKKMDDADPSKSFVFASPED
jgi:hypothetical protein